MTIFLDLGWLSRLRLVSHRRRRGGAWGERRSVRRGSGLEFADYRDYSPGDDPRRLDWALYARLDRPYVRLFEEEEDLAVTVLVDGSASMDWGAGESWARWPAAQRLAAALGALALLEGDTLAGALLQGERPAALWGAARGRGRLPEWEAWSEGLTPGGAAALGPGLQAFAARPVRPGLILLLTDGYDVPGLSAGLTALAGRGHEVVLLHLLTPEEVEPTLRGDLRLVDVESDARREVTVDGAALAAYRERLAAWQAELRGLAGQHGGRYALLRTDAPLSRLLLEELRHASVVH